MTRGGEPDADGVRYYGGERANTVRGNVTQAVSPGSTVSYAYNVTGQMVTGANAMSGTGASLTYSSATNFAAPDTAAPLAGSGDVQNSHTVTQASSSALTTTQTYWSSLAPWTSTMPNAAVSSQVIDPTTGLLTSTTSVYGATTSYTYRFSPTIVTASTSTPTTNHWSKSYKDGFGRDLAVEAGYGSRVVSHTDTKYAPCACSPLGKANYISLPYGISGGVITASDGTSNIGWNSYVYDGLGRTLTQTAADASPTSYVYLGNTVKVTDPAGNWKRYTSDTLGNLVKVEEPNPAYGQADNTGTNFVTNYAYDVEGHLVSVAMPRPGASQPQTRTFNYNLATNTLTSSTNPENGTVSYTYYGDGLLKSKTDAKGQQVQYSYDGYGRLAYIDRYTDAVTWLPCQSVALTYDSSTTGTNLLGRVSTAVTGYSSSCTGQTLAEYYGYTPGGQVTLKKYGINYPAYWATPSVEYIGYQEGPTATFSYDTEGHQTGYNSFTYTLDAMGRPTGLTETGPGTVWAQNAAYGPSGEMQTMQYRSSAGSYFTENRTYNSRVQLIGLASSLAGSPQVSLKYNYTAGVNNGQVASMGDGLTGEQTVYTYDSLKRLIKGEASVSLWGQSFGYDGWGNLFSKTPTAGHTGTTMSLSVDPTTNRVMATGFAYDANGNMTSVPGTPQNIGLTYDVENRTGGTWYDQQNQPLDRGGVWNEYGLRGERLGTFSYTAGYTWQTFQVDQYGDTVTIGTPTVTATQLSRNIYFGGRLIQSNGTTVATDRLGSVRVDENGNKAEYYPYGETVSSSVSGPDLFGTYAREASGLDYANQRYYASAYGRFTSPDRYTASAGPGDPTSWNRYSYTRGDPVNRYDPSGMFDCNPDDPSCDPCDPSAEVAGCGCDPEYGCGSGEPEPPPDPGPAQPPPNCLSVLGLPSDAEAPQVAVLLGENSWGLGYSPGAVANEDLYMEAAMYNLAGRGNTVTQSQVDSSIKTDTYRGYPAGASLLSADLLKPASSRECQDLTIAESAYTSFWGVYAEQPTLFTSVNQWVALSQHGPVAPGEIVVAGTVFSYVPGAVSTAGPGHRPTPPIRLPKPVRPPVKRPLR